MTRSLAARSTAFAATATVVGISTLFVGAAPANADPVCGADGTLISPSTCQQTFNTSGDFQPNASMTTLQVLLVAGGGAGATTSANYGPLGGGGGEVKVVDFSTDVVDPVHIVVGGPGLASSATSGVSAPETAAPGSTPAGLGLGQSGNGNNGDGSFDDPTVPGGGGGAGAAASGANGGAGLAASAAGGSLFASDANCYGGGGAAGLHGGTTGTATCGGGTVTDTGSAITAHAPATRSGGGGSATGTTTTPGASGVVVVRWNAPASVTLTFGGNLHGASVAPEAVITGTAPTKPANPTSKGYVFKGWFTDPGLTTPADFSAPLNTSATFFASFTPALPATGGGLNPGELPVGLAALGAGLALAVIGARRRTRRTA